MSKIFRWAFIGCGAISHIMAKQITKSGRHQITAIYNRNIDKAYNFSKKFGGKVYENAEDAIAAEDVDGVYIAVGNNLHTYFAEKCLKHNKPILCEKPFAVNEESAKEIFSLAKEKNIYLTEAMWPWYNRTARKVRSWIENGEIGKIKKMVISLEMPIVWKNKKGRLTDLNMAGGALLDLGVYTVTYCYNLLGKPEKINCISQWGYGVDLSDKITLSYKDGVECELRSSIDRWWPEECLIIGERGKIVVPLFHQALKANLYNEKGLVTFKDKHKKKSELYLHEFDMVACEIRVGRKESKLVPPQGTIEVLGILDECRKQIGLRFPMEKKE